MTAPIPMLNGDTRLYLVIGDPISQVKSPALFTQAAQAAEANAIFVPYGFPKSDFDAAISALRQLGNLGGLVVTIPFKPRMLEVVDHVSDRARRVGALNVVRVNPDGSWSGDALDGAGFMRGLEQHGVSAAGKRVQLIGAGGAGASVAVALADAGARSLHVHDLDNDKTRGLVDSLNHTGTAHSKGSFHAAPGYCSDPDLIINASPCGMRLGDPLPCDPDLLAPHQVVAELIMEPDETPLLAAARKIGCTTIPGSATLTGQIDEMLSFFGFAASDNRATT